MAKPDIYIFLGKYQEGYEKRLNSTVPLYIRIKTYLQKTNFETPAIASRRIYNFPCWQFLQPTTITDLHKLPKNSTTSVKYRATLDKLLKNLTNQILIYTDGSKSANECGCAIATPDIQFQFKLPDYYNAFRWEAYAILQAIQAIANTSKFDHITQEIQETLCELLKIEKEIIFTCTPSHLGIKVNEIADSTAKLAYLLPATDPKTSKTKSAKPPKPCRTKNGKHQKSLNITFFL